MRAIQKHAAAQLPVTQENQTDDRVEKCDLDAPTCLENAAQRARRCKAARSGELPDQAAAADRAFAPRAAETP